MEINDISFNPLMLCLIEYMKPLSYFAFTLAFTVNIGWYWMKSILNKNGYKVNYFHGHMKDFPNFIDLIGKEIDLKKKRKYKALLVYTASCIPLLIIVFFLIVLSY